MINMKWLAAAAIIISAPIAAQTVETQAHIAADAREIPQTAALNNSVTSNVTTTQAMNAEAQAQYDADKQVYWAQLRANHREIAEGDAHYTQQQAAYAAAMRDWRMQTILCKNGHQRACELPTPDPANYM